MSARRRLVSEDDVGIGVLVCGGRYYENEVKIYRELDKVHKDIGIAVLIHGTASGADTIAEEWAKRRQIPYFGVPAKWNTHGRSAGPIRNAWMLKEASPDLIMAFHDDIENSKGTKDMMDRADDAGYNVKFYD